MRKIIAHKKDRVALSIFALQSDQFDNLNRRPFSTKWVQFTYTIIRMNVHIATQFINHQFVSSKMLKGLVVHAFNTHIVC